MLNRLLDLMREGGTHRIRDLADELGATPVLVEVMLGDLARMGYVKRVDAQGCRSSPRSEACATCPLSGMCAAGMSSREAGNGQVWRLAEERKAE